jgi:putative oxidoreductase
MELGKLVLRGTVGPLFMGHGAQKLFGTFGGHGLEGTGGFFETLGLKPGRQMALAAGAAEFAGGLLVTLGALTPLGATMISSTMVTAIRKVHAPNGPWVTNNGFEYNAVLVAAMTALVESGPGAPSVDDKLLPRLRGPFWAALSLGGALAASYLATNPKVTGSVAGQEGAQIPGDPAAADEPRRFERDAAPATTVTPPAAG